jgi:hypothetical protein
MDLTMREGYPIKFSMKLMYKVDDYSQLHEAYLGMIIYLQYFLR